MNTRRVRNVRDLTASLFNQYERYLNGEISAEEAKTSSHVARTALLGLKVQLEDADRLGSKDIIPGLGCNVRSQGPTTIPASLAPVEPPRPTLHDVIMHALEMATEPMSEQALCEKLMDEGALPATYVDDHRHQIGGPYELIRGVLLKAAKEEVLTMSTNGEGRAVFQMKRAA